MLFTASTLFSLFLTLPLVMGNTPPENVQVDSREVKRDGGVFRIIPEDYTLFEFPAPHQDLNCRSNDPEGCYPELKFTNEWKDQAFVVKEFALEAGNAGAVEAMDVDFTTRKPVAVVQCTARVDSSPTETIKFQPHVTPPFPQESNNGVGHLTCATAAP
ncbi:hypothetical protein I204_03045 [Kwoniella mangroviensis CBS 8886]|uniref:uncharacterized protein n=1 Tax=Kwoniella mangroviensis CBS 8507 TaxID=1296122 RepID=UPI00080D7F57|nr:uncharacterized protein I203_00104 [Kwoniella mangroviensis CBS 8507]OCF69977.1 hypothetical protein I203_00104 [Kwoniella mangroviensis CBS 8507]OCF75753.1 hypothetical protein I204_03045 [Kwoniella mangroviensis CBS 8886]